GFAEDYDATREPDGWQEKAFGPAMLDACPNATPVPDADDIWSVYEPRTTPYNRHEFVAPARFTAYRAAGPGADAMGEVGEYQESEPLEPVVADQPVTGAALNALAGRANAFTFDLLRECVGHFEFEIDAPAGRVIEVSGAELLQ